MIPKIIHYIWFGDPLKKPIERIGRWRRVLSDYQFREWNEIDFNIDKYAFARRAYDIGKYGISIDPFRIEILEKHGGIWFDTDVEVHEDLSPFLNYSFFFGYSNPKEISVGVMGVSPYHPLMIQTREWYEKNWSPCISGGLKSIGELFDRIYINNYVPDRVILITMKKLYGFMMDGQAKTLDTRDGLIRIESPPVFTFRGNYKMKNYAEHLGEGSWESRKPYMDYGAHLKMMYDFREPM